MNEETLKAIEGSIISIVEGIEVGDAVDSLLGEQLTHGIRNALSKGKVKVTCAKCSMPIPVYPGRYPNNCPECGESFAPVEEPEDTKKEE